MRRVLRSVHAGLVFLLSAGVLVQAALAGQFISGLSNALPTHGAVGGVLELVALLLLIVAVAHRFAGERSRAVLGGSLLLAVAVQVQAGLGWAPGALPTALHVPLGVVIFAGAVALSGAMLRLVTAHRRSGADLPGRTPSPAGDGGRRP